MYNSLVENPDLLQPSPGFYSSYGSQHLTPGMSSVNNNFSSTSPFQYPVSNSTISTSSLYYLQHENQN
jgi:hypothetical protein